MQARIIVITWQCVNNVVFSNDRYSNVLLNDFLRKRTNRHICLLYLHYRYVRCNSSASTQTVGKTHLFIHNYYFNTSKLKSCAKLPLAMWVQVADGIFFQNNYVHRRRRVRRSALVIRLYWAGEDSLKAVDKYVRKGIPVSSSDDTHHRCTCFS